MKYEYKIEKAYSEADINNYISTNSSWKPINIIPIYVPLTEEQKSLNWYPVINFLIIFEREKND